MKHTPGPWKIEKINGAELSIMSKNGYVAQACTRNEGLVNAEANAHLIAAAPDLLEACKYVIKQLKNVKGKAFPIMPILNAIAKAEGGGI